MNRPVAALLCATALSGSLLFGACAAGPPAENPASAPSSAGASTPAPEPAGSGAASKPSKDDIVAGLTAFYESSQGMSGEQAKKFATCMVDKMYDRARAKTLTAMENGDSTAADPADAGLIAAAGFECSPD